MDADSREAAVSAATARGYLVLGERGREKASKTGKAGEKRSTGDLLVFVEQLQSLIKAGLSVPETLEVLSTSASGGWADVASALLDGVGRGLSLSEAMRESGHMPELLAATVASGEMTSDLTRGLEEFAEHERKAEAVRAKVISVTLYPALVVVVGMGVLAFLAFFVMPRFAQVFVGMQGELPWAARVMVLWKGVLDTHLSVVASAAVAAGCAVMWLIFSGAWKRTLWKAMAATPSAKRTLETYYLARWYRGAAMMASGGVPLPVAVERSADILPPHMKPAAASVVALMRQGNSPSESYRMGGMSTSVLERMLCAGEKSGQAGPMLSRAADFHDADVVRWMDRAMKLAEPIVMTVIGALVGLLVVMMYMPVFELASAVR